MRHLEAVSVGRRQRTARTSKRRTRRLAIVVQGGVVQGVYSQRGGPLTVCLLDYDDLRSDERLEAMARRVPVVASAVGGIPEVITSGTDGLLVPPGDSAALADAISSLLTDEGLRSRIGAAGYRTVVERYSIDAQVKRTELVYDEELARAGVLVSAIDGLPGPPDRAALEVPPV